MTAFRMADFSEWRTRTVVISDGCAPEPAFRVRLGYETRKPSVEDELLKLDRQSTASDAEESTSSCIVSIDEASETMGADVNSCFFVIQGLITKKS